MAVNNAMFIYVRIVVVLIYFIDEDRINQFEGEIQPPNWLELSEKWCVRTTPKLAAAERIRPINTAHWPCNSPVVLPRPWTDNYRLSKN
jgi:hypothetical protein